jgi:putative redox protein
MARNVSVNSGALRYAQTVSIGSHVFHSDEPADVGGNDTGPNAQELLMASLGACANITVQMYAERHQWPLKGVRATVSYARVLAENNPDSESAVGMVDQFEMEISFVGNLSAEQQQRLLEIAQRCPVHRMLVSQVLVHTRLLASTSRSA